jgi:hypothetical protein
MRLLNLGYSFSPQPQVKPRQNNVMIYEYKAGS